MLVFSLGSGWWWVVVGIGGWWWWVSVSHEENYYKVKCLPHDWPTITGAEFHVNVFLYSTTRGRQRALEFGGWGRRALVGKMQN